MNKLSLKMKLGLGFGALLVIMAFVGGMGYYSTFRFSDLDDRLEKNGENAVLTATMEAAIEKQSTGVRGFLLAGKEDLLKHDEEGQQEFKASADKLDKSLSTEEEKKLFAEILRKFEEFRKIADTEIQLRRSGKAQEAERLAFSPQTAQVRTELRAAMEQLNSIADKISAATKEEGNALESTIRTTTLVATLCGFALGIVVAMFIV